MSPLWEVSGSFLVVWRNCWAKQEITVGLEVRVGGISAPSSLVPPHRGGGAALCAAVCHRAFPVSRWDAVDFLCVGYEYIQRGVVNVRVM